LAVGSATNLFVLLRALSRMDPPEMMLSYSPDVILDQAWQWRTEAATASDPVHGAECLRRAMQYEQLVRQSIEIAPIK
jgi:hypothetical protein